MPRGVEAIICSVVASPPIIFTDPSPPFGRAFFFRAQKRE